MVMSAAVAMPEATDKALLATFHVLLATLVEAHVAPPFCSVLSAAAAWDILHGHHWRFRACASGYMGFVSPAFPLDSGTPLRNERAIDPAQPDEDMSEVSVVARNLVSELAASSEAPASQQVEVQSGLTQQMGELSLGDDSCPVCFDSLREGAVWSWPDCSVAHRLHVACAAALSPMQRALAHLSNSNDATRICRVPCIICRMPWGENAAGNQAVQQFCSQLESEGIPLPSHGCQCGPCRNITVGQGQAQMFETNYGNSRAADIHSLFANIVSQAQQAQDIGNFLATQRWSAILVPFIWMAAAATGDSDTQWAGSWEQLCRDVPVRHESGMHLGPGGVRDARLHLRGAFRASGVDNMEDLRNLFRRAKDQIEAWARQDSRFSTSILEDDHFNVGRGAYLQDYVQELLIMQAERAIGVSIGSVVSANLQEAARLAAQRQERGASTPGSSAVGCGTSSTSQNGGGFVREADLVTGMGWQESSAQAPGAQADGVSANDTEGLATSRTAARPSSSPPGAYASRISRRFGPSFAGQSSGLTPLGFAAPL